jgi:hypothetical protein
LACWGNRHIYKCIGTRRPPRASISHKMLQLVAIII